MARNSLFVRGWELGCHGAAPACAVSGQYPGHADPESRAGIVREGEAAAAATAAGFGVWRRRRRLGAAMAAFTLVGTSECLTTATRGGP